MRINNSKQINLKTIERTIKKAKEKKEEVNTTKYKP